MGHHKFTDLCNTLVLFCFLFTFIIGNPVNVAQNNDSKQTALGATFSPRSVAERQTVFASYSTHRSHKTHAVTRHSGHHSPYVSGASKVSALTGSYITGAITSLTSQNSAVNRRYEFPTYSTHGNTADRWDHSYPSHRHSKIMAARGYSTLSTPPNDSFRILGTGVEERDVSLTQEVSTTGANTQPTYSSVFVTHSWSSHGYSSYPHHSAYFTHARHSNHSDHSTHARPSSRSYHSQFTNSVTSGQSTLNTGSLSKRQLHDPITTVVPRDIQHTHTLCVKTFTLTGPASFQGGTKIVWTSTAGPTITIACHHCWLTTITESDKEPTPSPSRTRTISSIVDVAHTCLFLTAGCKRDDGL